MTLPTSPRRLRAGSTALSATLFLLGAPLLAQGAPPNGPRRVDPRWHAFVNATVVTAPGTTLQNATVVVRDGVVVAAGTDVTAPEGARVWDCRGRYIYPGLVEPYLTVDAPAPPSSEQTNWNEHVTPQRSALDGKGPTDDDRQQLRELGFGAAGIAPAGGVLRGSAAVVLLDDPGEDEGSRQPAVVRTLTFQSAAFERSRGSYPSSLMGAVALVRQTLLDADWHRHNVDVYRRFPASHEPPTADAALEALADHDVPLWFETHNELEALTAIGVAEEMKRSPVIVGSGTEFRRLPALADRHARLVLPVAFPDPPPLATAAEADAVSLRELMTWEQAPTNPGRVVKAGLQAALTTHGLDKRDKFWANVRSAIRHGLSEEHALAMLTTEPAALLGVSAELGVLEPGHLANLVITDGPLFDAERHVLDVWVRGRRYVIRDPNEHRLDGRWTLATEQKPPLSGTLHIDGGKIGLRLGDDDLKAEPATATRDGVDFALRGKVLGGDGAFRFHGLLEADTLLGTAVTPSGERWAWTAHRAAATKKPKDDEHDDEPEPNVPDKLPTPLGAFGRLDPPEQQNVLVKNVTLWGVEGKRVLEHAALVTVDGKVAYIGPTQNAPLPPGGIEIDGTGKHLTPGLIDAHSHTGIMGGVNEGTQAVTAEVRVQDALDPDDINWYRQLAGGVTAVLQLHGSANPIGGQSNVVKLRWGVRRPQLMHARGSAPGIKFALGENVKRSNSSREVSRYPRTRMGVETLLRDRFQAALEYARAWQRYRVLPDDQRARIMQPRRDLELDALTEVLSGIRLVHCHSYRQDEILMLCRVAKDFGFRIGTFQHGLECYKVAEAVRESAIGASVFSDWWAYKFEVFDAIPQNGSILSKLGIPVSFNSDSSELARRLNTEAAKAVKYGGTSPRTAIDFVTRGPAIQLKMLDRIGSFWLGKSADFALWSASPLSTFARCEATYIDSREYFSLDLDAKLRKRAEAERQRLLQKVLAAGRRRDKKKDKDTKASADRPQNGPKEER